MTHRDLVNIGAKWLIHHRVDMMIPRFEIVVPEKQTILNEEPDIFAMNDRVSIKIEVKMSRSDYNKDKNKCSIQNPSDAVGNFRYYLTSSPFLSLKDLPYGWGLLQYDPDQFLKIKLVHIATNFFKSKILYQNERTMLIAVIKKNFQDLAVAKGQVIKPGNTDNFKYTPPSPIA